MKAVVLCSVLVAFVGWIFFTKSKNNVCRTFEDYYTDRDSNENCYYNPDGELEVPNIIRRHGYPVETHEITTEDGYILTLFRIPHGKNSSDNKNIGPPVLINHCGFTSSVIYVYTGNKSLAFILADAGYDVWLGNLRGSMYSRKHSRLTEKDLQYWEFSFHEMGIYDIPAQIEHIRSVTEQKLIYIGYLLSATASFVYGTTYPDIAFQNVKMFINLSPAVFFPKTAIALKIGNWLSPVLKVLRFKQLMNGRMFIQPLPNALYKLLCFPFPFQMKACQIMEQINLGFDYEQNDPETLPITLLQTSDACSMTTIDHYNQLESSGNFQHFDYGADENTKIYGTASPKPYNLTHLKVPTYLIAAKNDLLVTRENVEMLYEFLPNATKTHGMHVIEYEKFNHLDFIKAKDVRSFLYNHLVSFMNAL